MLLIVGSIMVLFGGWILWTQRKLISLGWRSRSWIPARAKVIESRFHNMEAPYWGMVFLSQSQRSYTWEYHVAGRTYTSTDYSFGEPTDRPPPHHMAGDHVTIYYDPECPSRAVVKPGLRLATHLPAIAFILGGGWLLIKTL